MINSSISVIVPAFNEARVIHITLKEIATYLTKNFSKFEIIVVDDGSTDKTKEEAGRVKNVKIISNNTNRGKGYAVRRGVLASKGELILFMDADNSTNISELHHFLTELRDYDIVIGSRAHIQSNVAVRQNIIKTFIGKFGNKIIQLILGISINDTQCGFKLYKKKAKELFEKQTIDGWGFDFEILFMAKKKGYRIFESPVTWVNNFNSSVKSLDYFKSFMELMSVRINYFLNKY